MVTDWPGLNLSESPGMSDIQIQPQPIAIARTFAVIAAASVLVLVLAWLLTGGGGEIFEPKTYLYSHMKDASGLIVTAPVQLNGIQIGKITDVSLSELNDPKKVVRVEMKVKWKYLSAIPVDSTVMITADNILGDKYLNITSGHRAETIRPGGELRSILPIADQFNSADLVAALKDDLNKIDASIRRIEDPNTALGNFVLTEDFYDRLRTEIVAVQKVMEKFATPESDLGKLFFSDQLYEQIRAPIVNLDKVLSDLQAGEGASGHFLATDEQYENVRRELADIRKSIEDVNAGRGRIGKLTQSDEGYRELQRLVNTIGEMVDSVKAGEGRVNLWLGNSQAYESMVGSMAELQQSIGDFRRNPRKYLRLKVF